MGLDAHLVLRYSRRWAAATPARVRGPDRDVGCMYATLWAQPLLDIRAARGADLGLAAGRFALAISAAATAPARCGDDQPRVAVLRGSTTREILGNVQLLLVAGLVLGSRFDMRQAGAAPRGIARRADRRAARLSRSITTAYCRCCPGSAPRYGIGGEAVELANLAAEQEVALRTLMSSRRPSPRGRVDLCGLLLLLAHRIDVVVPAAQSCCPRHAANWLRGQGSAEQRRQARAEARCWLRSRISREVVVSIRDDGVVRRRPAGAAAWTASGRQPIDPGRIADVGGAVESGPHQAKNEWS